MTYKLLDYPVHPDLRAEVLEYPLQKQKDGAGHAGAGYKRGWIGDLSNARIDTKFMTTHNPAIDKAVMALAWWLDDWHISQVMVNRLGPRSALSKHRDGATDAYRFHLPVVTNNDVKWWDEIIKQSVHFMSGYWYGPVPYANVMHSMTNDSDTARYHLIVDLEPPK